MDVIGGYRLVRKLGEGERAEVFLGHAGPGEQAEGERTAAIKVYRSTTSAQSIDVEIEALARASSRHLLALRDLAMAADGQPSLVLPRLGSGSLARLVETRSSLEAGEVVTAIAPIVAAVGELHRVGVAHGRIQLSAVLLDSSGAPILTGFGNARLIGPFPSAGGGRSLTPAQLEENSSAMGDLTKIAEMAGGLLGRVNGGDGAVVDLLAWLRETDPAADASGFIRELAERLFDLAPALALDPPVVEVAARGIPHRAVLPGTPHHLDGVESVQRRRLAAIDLPEWADAALGAFLDSDPLTALRARIVRALAPVRRPVWIAGGAGLVAVVIAFVVIPGSDGSTAAPGSATSQTPTKRAGPSAEEAGATDDPLVAARALLAARKVCISRRSVICLDDVDQRDSAAMDADVAIIRRLRAGDDPPSDARGEAELRLVQRLGDSAIIGVPAPDGTGRPASLLLLMGEAGWRIRDLILS